jgi:hypothetical protein
MHPDEGTIQAYVEGQLPAAELERVAAHVAACAECSDRVAETRGIVAAASRIVSALDDVPAHVIPARRTRRLPPWAAAAAGLLLVVGVTSVMWRPGRDVPVPLTTQRTAEDLAGRSPAEPDVVAEAPAPATVVAERRIESAPAGPRAPRPAPSTAPADVERDAIVGSEAASVAVSSASALSPSSSPPPSPPPPPSAPPPPPPPPPPPRPPPAPRAVVQAERATATAAPTAVGAAAFQLQPTPVPLRVVRYDAGRAVIELREYDVVPPPSPAGTRPSGISEYRWTNSAETRIYVVTGPFSAAELERLARRLAELPVVP